MTMPEKIGLRRVFFGDGKDGGYIHEYRNETYDVTVKVVAKTRDSEPTTTITCGSLPGEEFSDFQALRAKYNVEIQK